MLISIDESGTFVEAPRRGSWCVVAAYTFAERRKTSNLRSLARLKARYRVSDASEIKLKHISESDYFRFLLDLQVAGGALFAVATDGALANGLAIVRHQKAQVERIRANASHMKFEEGKLAVITLAEELDSLSLQLYIQLQCQVRLLREVIKRAILFHVQRDPSTLRRFVWRIDQKNTEKSTFERAFEKVAPGLLQSDSFEDPMIMLEGADYSHFSAFRFSADEYPDHLVEECGHSRQETTNIGKLLHDNMLFPDSRNDASVQIADLLAVLRKCLRGEFADNQAAAQRLGGLMVSNVKPHYPISFIHLAKGEAVADQTASDVANILRQHAQPMVV